ncbi:MAG: AAA family ATPase [Rudaea sp.]|uniref:AAA family ATPase n=1 Tax=unclassified Rudaea TaxID=2627037 RepID=UPI0010F6FAEE|nr:MULTISPECIES: AAA family ATPase [unclassified Rudaea]MBN8884665.1 AAA family ATPase [Rudaea sp.]MBR0343883.1 AAA family ATPase [Rudaea sp.]
MERILRHIELLRDGVPDWNQYPFNIPAVKKLNKIEFDPAVTFLIGENGSGKSTLTEAIAIKAGFNPEGGTKSFTSSLRPSESELHRHLRMARGVRREKGGFFLRAETMFNISTEAEDYAEYGWAKLHEKSHGEAFLWVVTNRFRSDGLFILDEPEAALSPQRQLVLLRQIHRLVKKNCQFIVSTHSPILMAYPGAKIFALDGDGVAEIDYESTEHYLVTRSFLQNPARMLRQLFAEDDDE